MAEDRQLIRSLSLPNRGKHLSLQLGLAERTTGAPFEQQRSNPMRLRNTRSTEIMHSSLEEPLSRYKHLEADRPHWPRNHHRFHLQHGIRVVDMDTGCISARDQHLKTKKGVLRTSSGTVTFSHTHRMKIELDVQELAKILCDGVPGGGHYWTPNRLEWIFTERTGRKGAWWTYDVPFKAFLTLFPKTFEQFGPSNKFVRSRHPSAAASVLDNSQEVVVRLARARVHGHVEQHPPIDGKPLPGHKSYHLPELQQHRVKCVFTPYHDGPPERPAERGQKGSVWQDWTARGLDVNRQNRGMYDQSESPRDMFEYDS